MPLSSLLQATVCFCPGGYRVFGGEAAEAGGDCRRRVVLDGLEGLFERGDIRLDFFGGDRFEFGESAHEIAGVAG